MDSTIDEETKARLNKAPILSACFMGLGQIVCLKQYVRGALYALVEVVFILAIIVGSKSIIPNNKKADDYLKGIPDTTEMVDYLREAQYKGLDKLLTSRADEMKKLFTASAPKVLGDAAYSEGMEDMEGQKDSDPEGYAQAVADAEQARQDAITEATTTYSELDYADIDAVSEASGDLTTNDKVYDKYLKISAKYDKTLAKEMAKREAKKFNANKKDRLPAYKEAVKTADIAYKDTKKELDKTNSAAIKELTKAYKAELKGKDNEERRKLSNDYNHSVDAIKDQWDKDLNQARFTYEDSVAEAFESLGGDNAFDAHYDGCGLCKKATNAGRRTTKHRVWFNGPIVSSLKGLISLGSRQNTSLSNYMDHSIFMMINGLLAIIIILFYIFLYQLSIGTSKKAIKKILWTGRFQTMQEAQNDMAQNSFATIGIAPSIVLIAIFALVPLLFSALIAFTNYSSPDHIPPNNLVDWVGLENFVTMFSTNVGGGEWAKAFGQTAIWTIVWAIFATFSCFFVGFFYAFVLQDKRIVIPSFFRTVYILPYAIPTMLSLFVWANLLNGTIGPINRTLQLIGLIEKPIPFLSSPWVAKGALIFVNIWIGFPYSMILTTSSMTAISASLYEAAVIDGATKWEQFKSITYPLVMFQLKPTLIMQFASNINNFGAVFFLTGGGPNMPQPGLTTATNCGATDLLISWIYKLTMNTPQRYQLASVLSLLVFVVLVPFALYNFTRTKSFQEGGI